MDLWFYQSAYEKVWWSIRSIVYLCSKWQILDVAQIVLYCFGINPRYITFKPGWWLLTSCFWCRFPGDHPLTAQRSGPIMVGRTDLTGSNAGSLLGAPGAIEWRQKEWIWLVGSLIAINLHQHFSWQTIGRCFLTCCKLKCMNMCELYEAWFKKGIDVIHQQLTSIVCSNGNVRPPTRQC